VATLALAADAAEQQAGEGQLMALSQSITSKNKRCELLLKLAGILPDESELRSQKLEEVEKVINEVAILEDQMTTLSQMSKRSRLDAVDTFLDATMNMTHPLASTISSISSVAEEIAACGDSADDSHVEE
jgi:hypothetical protein